MKILFKLLSTAALAFFLLGCTSIPRATSVFYQFTDNPSVNLLEFEYADFRQANSKNYDDGIGRISFSTYKFDDVMKIKWHDKETGEKTSKAISLKKGMPFIRTESRLRLTFNNSNQPEVYIFYHNLNAPVYFEFLNVPYSKSNIRQIYPEIKEININNNNN